ncbi:hypothetical protein LXA43DRAFT_331065 [Ganoderma leucocontextum]|nr:hypothetical protein LXA43DRAFT_331065 [Ganoderma leucocontextum]
MHQPPPLQPSSQYCRPPNMRSLIIVALSAIAMVSAMPVAVPSEDADPTLPIPTEPSFPGFSYPIPTDATASFTFSFPTNLPFGPGANTPTGTGGQFPPWPTAPLASGSPPFPPEGSLPASESSPFAVPSGWLPSGAFPPTSAIPTGSFEPGFPPQGFPASFPGGIPTGFPGGIPTGFPGGIPTGFPGAIPTGFPTESSPFSIQGFPSYPLPPPAPSESVSEPVPTDVSEGIPEPTATVSV